VDSLVAILKDDGFILYSGPTGKRGLAEVIRSRFKDSLGLTVEDLSSGWTSHLQQRYPMPNLQGLYNESFDAAQRGGLEQDLLEDLKNPYRGGPSWIFTHTNRPQILFSAHAVRDAH
jgi:hypothetical protein